MFWNIYERLCVEHKTTPNAVTKILGLSSATATKWKNGSVPNGKTLNAIANYFGVTTDYLLGKTDKKENSPTVIGGADEEYYLLANRAMDGEQAIQKLTKEEYEALIAVIKTFRSKPGNDL